MAGARHELTQWRNFEYIILTASIDEDLRRMLAILDAEAMKQQRTNLPPYE